MTFRYIWESRAKLMAEDQVKVRFKDVAGVDEAKEDEMEMVDFLKDPGKYEVLGGKIPSGVLLDWETLNKYQIDELMQGRMIAPPELKIETPVDGEDEHALSGSESEHQKPGNGSLVLS